MIDAKGFNRGKRKIYVIIGPLSVLSLPLPPPLSLWLPDIEKSKTLKMVKTVRKHVETDYNAEK